MASSFADLESPAAPKGPSAGLRLGRHVVGMAAAALANPLIYTGPAGMFSWVVPWIAALLVAGALYGLFLLFFTGRAKAAWPGSFIVLAWVLLALQLAGAWLNYSNADRLGELAQPATAEVPSSAGPKPAFEFDPSTARRVEEPK